MAADNEQYVPDANEPEGYHEWYLAKVDEALREVNNPNAVWLTQDQVEQSAVAQEQAWLLRQRKTA